MQAALLAVELAVILLVGFLVTTRLIPWAFVRCGRLVGFRMQPTPITRKRLARFKEIRRGYYAFLGISTLYVISLFLELFVNDKALVICYEGRYAFPAVADWLDSWLPFVPVSSYVKKGDFGLHGDEPVHGRAYAEYCANPELVRRRADALEAEWRERRASLPEPAPEKPAPAPEPPRGAAASAADAEAYAEYQDRLRAWEDDARDRAVVEELAAEIAALRASYGAFVANRAWIVMPLYPFGPRDPLLDLPGQPPHGPSWWPYLAAAIGGRELPRDPAGRAEQKILPLWSHPFGTTDNGLDVLAQLAYGFRISMTFALIVAAIGYAAGVVVGGIMGYYGGWTDILIQRGIEIYGSIPFLYAIMIVASIIQPGLIALAILLVVLRGWLGITYYVRGEFYREKAKDYVQSAIGTGVSDWRVMTRHILPNSLVPVVTWAPFGVVSYMLVLVSLDYLGFGLPPGTPSWGYLLNQGREYVTTYPHLILVPTLALAATLFCVVVIGEAVREAFDPKVFSRLR